MQKSLHPQQQDLGNFFDFIFEAISVVNYPFLLLDLLREQQNAKQLSLLVSYASPRFKGALKPTGWFLCPLHSSAEQTKQGLLLMGCHSQRRERETASFPSSFACAWQPLSHSRIQRSHWVSLLVTFLFIDTWTSWLKTGSEGGMRNSKANLCEEVTSPCFAWAKKFPFFTPVS